MFSPISRNIHRPGLPGARESQLEAQPSNGDDWLKEKYEATTGHPLPVFESDQECMQRAVKAMAERRKLEQLVDSKGVGAIDPDAIATGSLKAISTAFKTVGGPIGLALMHSITGPGGDAVMQKIFNAGEASNEKHHARRALDFVEQGGEKALDDIKSRALKRAPKGEGKEYRMALLQELYSPPGKPFHKFDRYRIMMQQGEAPVARSLLANADKNRPKSLSFPGSGSLPLTVDLLSIELSDDYPQVKTNLIDIDPEAVEISRRMLKVKEDLGIQPPGSQRIYQGDASAYQYRTGEARSETEISTDILFLAAALPTEGTASVVKSATDPNEPERQVQAVMGRSAEGLSQKLYEPLDFAEFKRQGLEVEYQAHPVQHLLNGSVNPEAHSRDKTLLMDHEVVNSLYGFRRAEA